MTNVELDQHFLKDDSVVEQMVSAAEINEDDIVLEIGPGKGIITSKLAEKAKKVIAIELDEAFKKYLDKLPENVEVIYGNASEVLTKVKFNKIVSNIPFSILEPFLKQIIRLDNIETVVLITSKHFSNLLSGEKKLALVIPLFFDVELIRDVPKTAFDPEPNINSALIRLKKRKEESILKRFFLMGDKKVKNALIESFVQAKKITKKEARNEVEKLDIPSNLLLLNTGRLSNEQFKVIYDKIS